MEPKCGITEISIVGCEIKILLRERDLLMLTGGMRADDSSMQDEKQKITRYGRELQLLPGRFE